MMAYPASRAWVNPRVRAQPANMALEHARERLCPTSPFFHRNFDLKAHQEAWAAGEARRQAALTEQEMDEQAQSYDTKGLIACVKNANDKSIKLRLARGIHPIHEPQRPSIRKSADGFTFDDAYGCVLSHETVFCPSFQKFKANIAPWPSKAESKYEGADRISTDPMHRRFLPAPRVEANETINWQHRGIIEQFPLDDFLFPLPTAVDIFMRTHYIPELEFDDEDGELILGKDLFEKLDPQDQW